jgi:hypothetical protein
MLSNFLLRESGEKLAWRQTKLDVFATHTNTHKSTFRSVVCVIVIALLVAWPFTAANAQWLEKVSPRLPLGVYLQGLERYLILSLTLERAAEQQTLEPSCR